MAPDISISPVSPSCFRLILTRVTNEGSESFVLYRRKLCFCSASFTSHCIHSCFRNTTHVLSVQRKTTYTYSALRAAASAAVSTAMPDGFCRTKKKARDSGMGCGC
eukprot:3736168-Rhodomonas_salina.1